MERRKSVRCAAIEAQKELQMKEEEAAKQLAVKPLETRLGSQLRKNSSKKSLHHERKKSGPKSKEPVASPVPQLSEYEKQIQQNIEERKKVFEMMVSRPKKEFLQALAASSSKQKSVKRQKDPTE